MRPIKAIRLVFLSLALLLVFALPAFASTLPSQQNISIGKEWRITFSQPVDTGTLQGNISITRTDIVNIIDETFPITPILDPNNSKVVIVKHTTPFIAGATYALSIGIGVKDTSGKSLSKVSSLSFTTISPVVYSFSNPAPLNITQTVQSYDSEYTSEITIKEIIRGSQALDMLPNKNSEPPKEGYEYILAKIYFGLLDIKDGKNLWVYSSKLKLVSESGRVSETCYATEPDPKFDATLYKGATVEGWAIYLVRKDDLHPKLSSGTNYDGTGGIWFKAYTD